MLWPVTPCLPACPHSARPVTSRLGYLHREPQAALYADEGGRSFAAGNAETPPTIPTLQ
jgi:hypothetical protein